VFYSLYNLFQRKKHIMYLLLSKWDSFLSLKTLISLSFFLFSERLKDIFGLSFLTSLSLSNYLLLLQVFNFLFMCNVLYEWNPDICKLYWEYCLNFYVNSLISWPTKSYIMIFIQKIPWIVNSNYAIIVNYMKWGN